MRRLFTALALSALAIIVGFALRAPQADEPISWCGKGQHAVPVGAGWQKDGTYLVAYECDRGEK